MRAVAFFGRILVSLNFILLGLASIYYWDLMKTDLARALSALEMHVTSIEQLENLVGDAILYLDTTLTVIVALQMIGGAALFFNYGVRFGAFLLLLYMSFQILAYHPFWLFDGGEMKRMLILFFSDLSAVGAILLLFSAGKRSIVRPIGVRKAKEGSNEG